MRLTPEELERSVEFQLKSWEANRGTINPLINTSKVSIFKKLLPRTIIKAIIKKRKPPRKR